MKTVRTAAKRWEQQQEEYAQRIVRESSQTTHGGPSDFAVSRSIAGLGKIDTESQTHLRPNIPSILSSSSEHFAYAYDVPLPADMADPPIIDIAEIMREVREMRLERLQKAQEREQEKEQERERAEQEKDRTDQERERAKEDRELAKKQREDLEAKISQMQAQLRSHQFISPSAASKLPAPSAPSRKITTKDIGYFWPDANVYEHGHEAQFVLAGDIVYRDVTLFTNRLKVMSNANGWAQVALHLENVFRGDAAL